MESSQNKLLKYKDLAGCLVLCLMIFVPMLLGLVQKDKDVSSTEKRALATFPEAPNSLQDIQTYPRLFETYYADHFGFRDWLIKRYKTVKYTMGDSPSGDLTLGKDDWLFLGDINETYTKFQDPFGDVRHVNLYTDAELKAFAENITTFEAWLAERDIPYVLVIPPNKHTVYFDKLPSSIERQGPVSALDQLLDYLRTNTTITVIDLRAALAEERKKHPVYYKTDTHWNHNGANIGQYEIMSVLNSEFSIGKPSKLYEMTDAGPYAGDLAGMLGVDITGDARPQPIFNGECLPVHKSDEMDIPKTVLWNCDTDKLKALIYHDSFFIALKPYFIRHFSRSTYISAGATPDSVKAQIAFDKPDVFIEEWIERKLPKPYVSGYELDPNHSKTPKALPKPGSELQLFEKLNKGLKLRNMERIDDGASTVIELKSIGKDPVIYLPDLDLKANQSYTLHVTFESDTTSAARLYYSTSDSTKFPFSDVNSVRLDVKKGDNDLRFNFSSPDLGKRLRLDILAGQGTVKISHVDLYTD